MIFHIHYIDCSTVFKKLFIMFTSKHLCFILFLVTRMHFQQQLLLNSYNTFIVAFSVININNFCYSYLSSSLLNWKSAITLVSSLGAFEWFRYFDACQGTLKGLQFQQFCSPAFIPNVILVLFKI